jgi:hypothetical protein
VKKNANTTASVIPAPMKNQEATAGVSASSAFVVSLVAGEGGDGAALSASAVGAAVGLFAVGDGVGDGDGVWVIVGDGVVVACAVGVFVHRSVGEGWIGRPPPCVAVGCGVGVTVAKMDSSGSTVGALSTFNHFAPFSTRNIGGPPISHTGLQRAPCNRIR